MIEVFHFSTVVGQLCESINLSIYGKLLEKPPNKLMYYKALEPTMGFK